MSPSGKIDNLHKLLLSGRRHLVKKGQVIHSSDGRLGLAFIKSGFVIRYIITREGTFSIHNIYGPGTFYPLSLVFQLLFKQELYGGPDTVYYEAMCDCEVYFVDQETFLRSTEENPELYKELLQEAGQRFYSINHRLENTSLSDATHRVAHELLYCAREFGEKKGKTSVQIMMPLTHSIIAGLLNLTRETISQSIGQLRQLGFVKASRSSLTVVDLKKLELFVYS